MFITRFWFYLDKITNVLPLTSLDKGVLHKSVVFEEEVHIVEEIQLLKNSDPIKNLLLSSEVSDFFIFSLAVKGSAETATTFKENEVLNQPAPNF